MIDARCECGVAYSAPEADAGKQSVLCRKCGREMRFVSAEALPDGAGAGDFDTRLVICLLAREGARSPAPADPRLAPAL